MANLSYLTIGIPASGRLVFRNIHTQPVVTPPTPEPTPSPSSGVRGPSAGRGGGKRRIVRRADFSSQAAYEYALRAALLEADFAIRPDDIIEQVEAKKVKLPVIPVDKTLSLDREIKLSEKAFAELQKAAEMDEIERLLLLISIIEDQW